MLVSFGLCDFLRINSIKVFIFTLYRCLRIFVGYIILVFKQNDMKIRMVNIKFTYIGNINKYLFDTNVSYYLSLIAMQLIKKKNIICNILIELINNV